ncbi:MULTISPECIES: single-stranded DNA-binding protein [Brucella]|uniref:Single-stranded DNA-binding protein n=1 Tax=Brucella tritici TaxID=94626 RepID=A0A6L3YD43_9HYPH|nr:MULTISPECIES: single-stranded DNA-binding protein [Brucella]KAB2681145.1 single-stranded DNA-binding protein [Brucella tritici]KAB2757375.1 single-stranded DNA-binding protein [Brucella anthropi]KAB2775249.1 single-stranded DNA-binding protein [Brucella anthropi]
MKTINRFMVNGNIGAINRFEKATKINVATDNSWIDEKGVRQESTDWVTVTVLDERIADYVSENANPGDAIVATGKMKNTSFKRGNDTVYNTDLIANVVNVFPKGSTR